MEIQNNFPSNYCIHTTFHTYLLCQHTPAAYLTQILISTPNYSLWFGTHIISVSYHTGTASHARPWNIDTGIQYLQHFLHANRHTRLGSYEMLLLSAVQLWYPGVPFNLVLMASSQIMRPQWLSMLAWPSRQVFISQHSPSRLLVDQSPHLRLD